MCWRVTATAPMAQFQLGDYIYVTEADSQLNLPPSVAILASLLLLATVPSLCDQSNNTCPQTNPNADRVTNQDRRACTSQRCLRCNHVDATCQDEGDNGTLRCRVDDVASCSVQPCDECSFCLASFDFVNGSRWRIFSDCSPLQQISDNNCPSGIISCRCRGNITLLQALSCSCFGDNCSSEAEFRMKAEDSTTPIGLPTSSYVTTLTPSQSPALNQTTGGVCGVRVCLCACESVCNGALVD